MRAYFGSRPEALAESPAILRQGKIMETETVVTSKNLALRCCSSNENYNADFDFALVTLTPELVARIEARRAIFNTAQAQDRYLGSMQFYGSYDPEYFSECELSNFAEELESADSGIASLIDGGEIEIIPPAFDPAKLHEDTRDFNSECDHMVVGQDGIRWNTTPKHSSITIETCELSYKDIKEMTAESC